MGVYGRLNTISRNEKIFTVGYSGANFCQVYFLIIGTKIMANKKDDKKPKLKLVGGTQKDLKPPRPKDQAITPKQSEFARLIAEEHMNSSQAYRLAYKPNPSATDKSIHEMACRVLANIKVKSRIAEIHRRLNDEKMTRAIRREEYVLKKLTEEVEQGDQASNRLKALHLLGQTVQMFGNKLEVETKQIDKTSEEIKEELKDKLSKLLGGES